MGASVRLSLSAMSANPEQSCGVATGHVAADARVKGKRGAEWRGIGIVRIAAERAAEARREADKLACDAWTKRMLAFKGPAQVLTLAVWKRERSKCSENYILQFVR